MRPFLALLRLELANLFAQPVAYLTLTGVACITALLFFDHLRVYNQLLFVYSTTTLGGFSADTIPDHLNLWDQVFFPVAEQLGITWLTAIPLITMRAFAEERARGSDELLLCAGVGPGAIVLAKFACAFLFALLIVATSFVYPATAITRGGVGAAHLASVVLGLSLHALGVASLGLACSAFTRSQLVAAVAGWASALVLWDWSWAHPFVGEGVAGFLDAVALHPRYSAFAEGSVELGNAVYFAALAAACAALARLSFDLRRAGS
jgi:ABC-2 type transport system permease protein